MISPLCQLADVAIALHARENRSTISPPPLTAITTLSTGTTVTSFRAESPLTPPHMRARRYAICIERERSPENNHSDIAGALLTRQKQYQNHYPPHTQIATVRALPPLRYHYNSVSFRQQTGNFRANLRRTAAVAATTTTSAISTSIVTASKKQKIEGDKNKVNKTQVSQQVESEHKTATVTTTTTTTKDMQLKIKPVEQLQQEQNLELLIKASEQHEKRLKKDEGKEETSTAAIVVKQQVVKKISENEKEMKAEKTINVIDLTDSDDEFKKDETPTTGQSTSQTSLQHYHRRRKRHHRRHRKRQTQKSATIAEQCNDKPTTKISDRKHAQPEEQK